MRRRFAQPSARTGTAGVARATTCSLGSSEGGGEEVRPRRIIGAYGGGRVGFAGATGQLYRLLLLARACDERRARDAGRRFRKSQFSMGADSLSRPRVV